MMNLTDYMRLVENVGINSRQENVQQQLVEVVLGNPNEECKRFGICKIEQAKTLLLEKKISPCKCTNKVYALASLIGDNCLELAFFIGQLPANTKNKYFKNSFFRVETSYLNMDLFQKPFTVETGKYPIINLGTLNLVRFPIREHISI